MNNYTYTLVPSEYGPDLLRREDSDGKVAWVPADPGNRDYAEFLNSGETAADYVAPAPAPEPTLQEKLASIGLDLNDLKEALR